MKVKPVNLAMIVIVHLTWSCVDPISFQTNSENDQLVFYGVFTQLEESHSFSISRTIDFGLPAVPVSDATITIYDDRGNSANYLEIELGKYQLGAGEFPGIPGRSYHVEITLADSRSFRSIPQQLPEPVQANDINFRIEPEQILGSTGIIDQTFINIYIDTELQAHSEVSDGLRWQVEEVYSFTDLACHPYFDPAITCYYEIPINDSNVKLLKSNTGKPQALEGFRVHSRILAPDDQFVERHYFSVYQHTISRETYDYWEKVKIVANQSGDLLDLPPASIAGNIHETGNPGNQALGYFEVNGKHIQRIFTLPYLIGDHEIIETCPKTRTFIIEDKCCFCSLLDEAENRINRPEYWND